ncbi:MAG TPA: hypothetical protein VJ824_05460 [Bacillota bacterium]|nr:hypothetical protein [Bacillota bacterium]
MKVVFNGATFNGDNTAIQSEHFQQTKKVSQGVSDQALALLISDIQKKVQDPDQKDQALLYVEELKKALKEHDKPFASSFTDLS